MPELVTVSARASIGSRPPFAPSVKDGIMPQVSASAMLAGLGVTAKDERGLCGRDIPARRAVWQVAEGPEDLA